MSFFGKLFGSEKAIDNISNAIDKTILTEEERQDLKLQFLKAYEPFKLAQRYFMMIVTLPYMFIWTLVGIGLLIQAGFNQDFKEIKDYIMNGDVIWIMLTMAGFYFSDTIAGKFKKQ